MDIIREFQLPSKGLVYGTDVKWQNRIRAPRLVDRGIGDFTRKNKLQAGILDKTVLEPLGISAYDLHTADFLYLNFVQRQLTKGDDPYKISVTCKKCGATHEIDFNLDTVEVNYLKEKPDMSYKTLDGQEIELNFLTPRIFDDAKIATEAYKEQFPAADHDIHLQELLRLAIGKIDGRSLTYSQKTEFIKNLYEKDTNKILIKLMDVDFGLQLEQTMVCPNCSKSFKFTLPV